MKKYTVKSSSVLYTHKRVILEEDIIELPDGTHTDYLRYGGLPDCVTLLVKDAQGRFLLLNEYTYPIDKYIYQMVGGAIDEAESPIDAAKRELAEEAGLAAEKYELLGTMLADHRRTTAKVSLFLVTDLTETPHAREAEEFIELEWLTEEEMQAVVTSGELMHAGSLSAWAYYLNKY